MSAMAAVDNSREQTHRERSPHELLSSPELRELVERLVRRKVPQGEVDDLVQTVLCDALEAATPPVEEEQLRRWLVGITRHKIADFHRSAGRGRQVELPEQLAADEPPIEAREWADWANPGRTRSAVWG